jgi:hypothetical protein
MGGGGQRIYTTAGRGYERKEYTRADLIQPMIDAAVAEAVEKSAGVAADDLSDRSQAMTDDLRIQLQEQARQAQYWRAEAERWQKLWERATNRLLQVDPEFNAVTFVAADPQASRLDQMRGDTAWNPWKDV